MQIYIVYVLTVLNCTSVFSAQMVLSLFALKLGGNEFQVGLLSATFAIFPMLLAVSAGRLVDRYGGLWPLVFGTVCGGLGLLIPFVFPFLWALFLTGALCGLSAIFFNLATQNLVGLLSTAQTRARYFSNYTLSTSLAQFIGPVTGGFLIDRFSHPLACMYLSILSVVTLIVLLTKGRLLPGGTGRKMKAGGGIMAMLKDPFVRQTLVTGSLINAGVNLFQVYLPVYAHSIQLSASTTGLLIAMYSMAAFIVRFGLPQLLSRFGETRVLVGAFLMGALTLALLPLSKNPILLGLLAFGFGMGMGCGQPIVLMLMFSNSKDGRSGEALGLKFTTNQLTKLVSPVCFGAIASVAGLLPMFLINASLMLFGGWLSGQREAPTSTNEE